MWQLWCWQDEYDDDDDAPITCDNVTESLAAYMLVSATSKPTTNTTTTATVRCRRRRWRRSWWKSSPWHVAATLLLLPGRWSAVVLLGWSLLSRRLAWVHPQRRWRWRRRRHVILTSSLRQTCNYSHNHPHTITTGFSTAAVFKLFWLRTPILLRHSWRTPTLVTVKFTAKYSNSLAHCFLQTNQHHQLYTNYNGRRTMLVWWMCLFRFAQTVNSWHNIG